MTNVLQFPAVMRMQGRSVKLPQFLLDEKRLDGWFWGEGFSPDRLSRRFSLAELKGHTAIPLARLPDVLRRLGWHRTRDCASGVNLWSFSKPVEDGDDEDYA